jgi:hypothetical protein
MCLHRVAILTRIIDASKAVTTARDVEKPSHVPTNIVVDTVARNRGPA